MYQVDCDGKKTFLFLRVVIQLLTEVHQPLARKAYEEQMKDLTKQPGTKPKYIDWIRNFHHYLVKSMTIKRSWRYLSFINWTNTY